MHKLDISFIPTLLYTRTVHIHYKYNIVNDDSIRIKFCYRDEKSDY